MSRHCADSGQETDCTYPRHDLIGRTRVMNKQKKNRCDDDTAAAPPTAFNTCIQSHRRKLATAMATVESVIPEIVGWAPRVSFSSLSPAVCSVLSRPLVSMGWSVVS